MVLPLSFSFIEIKFSVKHWRVSQNRQRMPVHEYQLYFSLLKLINRLLLSLTMIWYNVSLKQTDMAVPGEEYLWGWNQLWEKWLLMLTYLKIRTLRQGVHITDTKKKKKWIQFQLTFPIFWRFFLKEKKWKCVDISYFISWCCTVII